MTLPPFALVGRSQLHSASLRGEESSKFVGSFLPFDRKPTSLGFAVGRRGSASVHRSVSAVSVRAAKTAYPLAHSYLVDR